MFEQASRLKLRFESPKGYLSHEDLWDLSLSTLDRVAIDLHHQVQDTAVSFVDAARKVDKTTQLRFDIVKHVIDVKLKERDEAAEAKSRADKKQKLLEIISRKEDAALETSSVEELRQLLASL